MSDLLVGVLSALLATNQPAAISNLLRASVAVPNHGTVGNGPTEKALRKVMQLDDQARAEIDELIIENEKLKANHPELKPLTLETRIRSKLSPVRKAYEDLLARYPSHADIRLAYGSFLSESGEEEAGHIQWEKAKELDPKSPGAWNNLANYYGHNGPATNAFVHYARAIELDPTEPTYYQNLATTMYLFRADAATFLRKSVPQVLDDAMALYRKALSLDPTNFLLATDLAQSYYGFPTPRTGDSQADLESKQRIAREGLVAWTNAFRIARDDVERQGVQVHFARLNITAGRYELAHQALNAITNPMFNLTKETLLKKLSHLEEGRTNSLPDNAEVPLLAPGDRKAAADGSLPPKK